MAGRLPPRPAQPTTVQPQPPIRITRLPPRPTQLTIVPPPVSLPSAKRLALAAENDSELYYQVLRFLPQAAVVDFPGAYIDNAAQYLGEALIRAVLAGYYRGAIALLAAGADPNYDNEETTPLGKLISASYSLDGKRRMAYLLIRRGADPLFSQRYPNSLIPYESPLRLVLQIPEAAQALLPVFLAAVVPSRMSLSQFREEVMILSGEDYFRSEPLEPIIDDYERYLRRPTPQQGLEQGYLDPAAYIHSLDSSQFPQQLELAIQYHLINARTQQEIETYYQVSIGQPREITFMILAARLKDAILF